MVIYIDGFFIWKINFENNIWVISFYIVYTMNKSFIHVKNE